MKSSVMSTPFWVWWGDASPASPLCPRLTATCTYNTTTYLSAYSF